MSEDETILLWRFGEFVELPVNANDCVQTLSSLLNSVPNEFVKSAEFMFERDVVRIEYKSPETEGEFKARMKSAKQRADYLKKRDRDDYERLKKKFGD